MAGVNQRRRKRVQLEKLSLPSLHSTNAVSLRLFSMAIAWRRLSGMGSADAGRSTTAAELPWKALSANASICTATAQKRRWAVGGRRRAARPIAASRCAIAHVNLVGYRHGQTRATSRAW